MAKISPEKIEEMCRLYQEIGVYSQVAKRVGSSPATVKKYVSLYLDNSENSTAAAVKDVIHFSGEVPSMEDIVSNEFLKRFHSLLSSGQTDEELNELKQLWEEM